MNYKRLPLKSVLNFRDLGGYPVETLKVTKWRTIFRADGLFNLEKDDMDFILDYCKLKTVIDLRGTEEQGLRPNSFAKLNDIKFIKLPLICEDRDSTEIEYEWRYLETAYIGIIEHSKRQIKEVFEYIAESLPAPVLYNCTAGKDRTGIISALILGVCGVDYYDIAGDYEVSSTYIRRKLEKIIEPGKELSMEHVASPAVIMCDMLRHIDNNYGSVPDYLKHCGINNTIIEKLRKHFLAEAGW